MTSNLKVKASLLVSALAFVTGCNSDGNDGTTFSSANDGSLSVAAANAINVSDATSDQCPGGGKVYSLYIDSNHNGVEDLNETPLTSQVVCNGSNGATGATGAAGQNGTDGLTTLFLFSRVAVDSSVCASGSGLQISSGLDSDRSGVLDASEISVTTVLCDGQNGQTGTQGPAGSNGHSIVFASVPASNCPAGGVTTLMALDINDTGVYSALDPNQSSMTICNGQDGATGATGATGAAAPATPYTPVEPIMPCGDTVAYKEVLLRLSGGQVLASFSDDASGTNTRFSFLPDGSFIDTDSSGCNFSLSTSSDGLTRFISWFGQVQESWAISN
jgi:hypothetical protein